MKNICINNGYYQYKSENNEIFKSRLTKCLCDDVKTSSDILTYDGNTYIVGKGSFEVKKDKTETETTIILTLNMLSRFTDIEETFNILLSSPPKLYHHQKSVLPKKLKGYYELTHNKDYKKIRICDVKVVPETIMAYIANNEDSKYANRQLLVLDIGGYTSNIAYIEDEDFNADDIITVEKGMYYIDEEICNFFNGEYKELHCSVNDIEMARKRGNLYLLNDKSINLLELHEKEINNIYYNHVTDILTKCDLKGWNYRTWDILITGGGGMILYDIIKDILPQSELSNDPVFDNLNGMMMLKEDLF